MTTRTVQRIQRAVAGFTLVELIIAMFIASVLAVSVGVLLADSQRNFSRIFGRVNGAPTVDNYVALRAFDSICRRATLRGFVLDADGQSLEVYTYSAPEVTFPDRYARFYVSGTELLLEQGSLQEGSWQKDGSSADTITLAQGVSEVVFQSEGTALQMFLSFEDSPTLMPVVCSAIRQSY